MNRINFSVIICCYNSSNVIKVCLEHIAYQKLNGITLEVILVDNNCTDDTIMVALNTWYSLGSHFQLRITEEKVPGLAHARKKGVMEAKGEFVLWCDDDNYLHENYIKIANNIMVENKNIGVLGGRSRVISEQEIPHWFESFQGNYAVGCQSLFSGPISKKLFVWGAGQVIRKDVLKEMYSNFKLRSLGRIGKSLGFGLEDHEICFWHILCGFEIWYDEHLILDHFMTPERLTKEYASKLISSNSNLPESFVKLRDFTAQKIFYENYSFKKDFYYQLKYLKFLKILSILKNYLRFLLSSLKFKKEFNDDIIKIIRNNSNV
jgi:glycosyltransferase involved in cell wall biosynthesis